VFGVASRKHHTWKETYRHPTLVPDLFSMLPPLSHTTMTCLPAHTAQHSVRQQSMSLHTSCVNRMVTLQLGWCPGACEGVLMSAQHPHHKPHCNLEQTQCSQLHR
jgi:hypothetical protein